jgi:hypothetical protein
MGNQEARELPGSATPVTWAGSRWNSEPLGRPSSWPQVGLLHGGGVAFAPVRGGRAPRRRRCRAELPDAAGEGEPWAQAPTGDRSIRRGRRRGEAQRAPALPQARPVGGGRLRLPLPETAAVDHLLMRVGEWTIEQIREREQAKPNTSRPATRGARRASSSRSGRTSSRPASRTWARARSSRSRSSSSRRWTSTRARCGCASRSWWARVHPGRWRRGSGPAGADTRRSRRVLVTRRLCWRSTRVRWRSRWSRRWLRSKLESRYHRS